MVSGCHVTILDNAAIEHFQVQSTLIRHYYSFTLSPLHGHRSTSWHSNLGLHSSWKIKGQKKNANQDSGEKIRIVAELINVLFLPYKQQSTREDNYHQTMRLWGRESLLVYVRLQRQKSELYEYLISSVTNTLAGSSSVIQENKGTYPHNSSHRKQ